MVKGLDYALLQKVRAEIDIQSNELSEEEQQDEEMEEEEEDEEEKKLPVVVQKKPVKPIQPVK